MNEALKRISQLSDPTVITGVQSDGSYLDPAYNCIRVHCLDIVPQAVNPNFMTENSFSALLTSITDNGYAFPILIADNPNYDEDFVNSEIERVTGKKVEELSDIEIVEAKVKFLPKVFSGGQETVDVRDPNVRKYFKFSVVDGTHRILATLYGSPLYRDLCKDKKSIDIYDRSGGYVPCTILHGKTEQEMMSAEILFNSARGSHDLTEMKDIVVDMLRSGMSQKWISEHLFLSPSDINRFAQLGGIKAAFSTTNDLQEAWDPIKEGIAEKRKNINLVNAARRYVRKYRQLAGFENTVASDEAIDIMEAAKNLGWNPDRPNEICKSLDANGKVFEKELDDEED